MLEKNIEFFKTSIESGNKENMIYFHSILKNFSYNQKAKNYYYTLEERSPYKSFNYLKAHVLEILSDEDLDRFGRNNLISISDDQEYIVMSEPVYQCLKEEMLLRREQRYYKQAIQTRKFSLFNDVYIHIPEPEANISNLLKQFNASKEKTAASFKKISANGTKKKDNVIKHYNNIQLITISKLGFSEWCEHIKTDLSKLCFSSLKEQAELFGFETLEPYQQNDTIKKRKNVTIKQNKPPKKQKSTDGLIKLAFLGYFAFDSNRNAYYSKRESSSIERLANEQNNLLSEFIPVNYKVRVVGNPSLNTLELTKKDFDIIFAELSNSQEKTLPPKEWVFSEITGGYFHFPEWGHPTKNVITNLRHKTGDQIGYSAIELLIYKNGKKYNKKAVFIGREDFKIWKKIFNVTPIIVNAGVQAEKNGYSFTQSPEIVTNTSYLHNSLQTSIDHGLISQQNPYVQHLDQMSRNNRQVAIFSSSVFFSEIPTQPRTPNFPQNTNNSNGDNNRQLSILSSSNTFFSEVPTQPRTPNFPQNTNNSQPLASEKTDNVDFNKFSNFSVPQASTDFIDLSSEDVEQIDRPEEIEYFYQNFLAKNRQR